MAAAPDPIVAFAEYAQQTLGVPWPTQRDMATLRKKVKEIFSHYPRATFFTLCRIVQWARGEHRRFDRVWKVVDAFRQAFVKGVLPELDPPTTEQPVEERITAILQDETSAYWRRLLIGAQGVEARRHVLGEWEAAHGVH